MAATIPTIEPLQVTAGDTVEWTITLSDYEAPTWSLVYYLSSSTASYTLTSTDDGTGHAMSEAGTVTALWTPGDYKLLGYATDGTDRHEVYRGSLTVLPNPATLGITETRSHARICLDKIEAVIEGKAGRDDMNYTINGTSLQHYSWDELLRMRNYYAAIVKAEMDAELVARGEFTGKDVWVRFK